ncbi:MAG: AraC family transcriptional regulator, partial [Paenibacillus sp.]|nr:AraC family transcriptional regulator [Paenibacillus sp.]
MLMRQYCGNLNFNDISVQVSALLRGNSSMRLRKYDYKTITSATRDTIGKGSHPFHYELLYIVSGKTKLQSLGESYETEGRALFIIPPGTPHHLMKASPHYSFLYIELEVSPSETFIPLNQLVVWNRLQTSCGSEHKWIANVYRIWDDICSFLHSEVAENSEVLEEVCVLDIQKTLALMRFTVEQADHLNQPADKRLSIGNEHASPKAIVEALARLLESHYMYNLTMQS